jgi:hypothetical protein
VVVAVILDQLKHLPLDFRRFEVLFYPLLRPLATPFLHERLRFAENQIDRSHLGQSLLVIAVQLVACDEVSFAEDIVIVGS